MDKMSLMNLSNHTSEDVLSSKLEEAQQSVEVGALYVHYRSPDKPYKVLAVGLLEENEKPCVVYQALHDSVVWVRALDSWLSDVSVEGKIVSRFQKVV
ncbi:MAG: DUF1653 domain-containing protein [Verrucomicrobia bacterium]|nr:DUF1653 domain-containing protein [Verrucomicrobiota bacterium]